jgi:F-type H+-transporting ATPase subunit beta
MEGQNGHPNSGTVVSVRGSIVDAQFPEHLPSLHHLLRTGEHLHIVIEVTTYLDAQTVRGSLRSAWV